LDFNPRARAGRDVCPSVLGESVSISIHAPARGATYVLPDDAPDFAISIHAPARGATVLRRIFFEQHLFQSTRPRGARRMRSTSGRCATNFNPRARAGRDPSDHPAMFPRSNFNPRAGAGRDGINKQKFLIYQQLL